MVILKVGACDCVSGSGCCQEERLGGEARGVAVVVGGGHVLMLWWLSARLLAQMRRRVAYWSCQGGAEEHVEHLLSDPPSWGKAGLLLWARPQACGQAKMRLEVHAACAQADP
eukprot:1160468-Pelagomonas_calceolata.AAC.14